MINEELLNREFYLKDGEPETLCAALSCFNQAKYQVLKNYDYNGYVVFCNDINIRYEEKINEHMVYPEEMDNGLDLFTCESYEVNDDFFDFIKQKLQSGVFLVFSTMFELLPCYLWYDEKKTGKNEHDTHASLLVDYDEKYYYITDGEGIFDDEKSVKYSRNSEICLVEREIMHEAFKKCCKIVKISVNKRNSVKNFDLMRFIKKIVIKYYRGDIVKTGDCVNYHGISAYIHLLNSMISSDYDFLRNKYFGHHWFAYLTSSRHYVLRCCIEQQGDFGDAMQKKLIIQKMKDAEELWFYLRTLIMRHNIQALNKFKEIALGQIIKIIENEIGLFELLRVFTNVNIGSESKVEELNQLIQNLKS